MNKQKPPRSSKVMQSLFLVGKNRRGQWVARNRSGSQGGLFVDRGDALKFAMFDSGSRIRAVILVPGVLELDMNSSMDIVTGIDLSTKMTRSQRPVGGQARTNPIIGKWRLIKSRLSIARLRPSFSPLAYLQMHARQWRVRLARLSSMHGVGAIASRSSRQQREELGKKNNTTSPSQPSVWRNGAAARLH